jgi:predicted nucleic acid-binding protein
LILLDTSGLFEALGPDQPQGSACRAVLNSEAPPRIVSPFVLAELDHLLSRHARTDRAALALFDEIARGTYVLATFDRDDVAAAAGVVREYADNRIGLTDASIVVLAERYRTNRVLTLDKRHFRALRTRSGDAFTLLPTDA